jgi:cytochrome c peroxidase
MKTAVSALMLSLAVSGCVAVAGEPEPDPADGQHGSFTFNKINLGRQLFHDTSLSTPAGQGCVTCHDSTHAFSDPRLGADGKVSPTSLGATSGLFGSRNSPSITYASFIPPLAAAGDEAGYAGGLFWDGRATTLEDQASGPVLNPVEMGNPDAATLMAKVKVAPYAGLFKALFGSDAFSDPAQALAFMTQAIATYERLGIPARFTSKYDAYLAGQAQLTATEARGLALFEDARSGGGTSNCLTLPSGATLCGCAQCHLSRPADDGTPPLFTDFGYDNLGIPRNPNNKFYTNPAANNPDGARYVDHGLSASNHNPRQDGKFKAPTLRNIALTAPYGHNGYFPDLASIVHFYNTRDVVSAGWPAAEVSFAINSAQLGNLGLSAQDEADLVAFMNTLTDGYMAAP